MAAVEVDGLTVRYGEVVAVDAVSFEAQAGQITAVVGPNGAGKTTTVEVLEGFRHPDAGRGRRVDTCSGLVRYRAPMMRPTLAGSKNSGTGRVPACMLTKSSMAS